MIYYNQPNIALSNQAKAVYPNNVYLPLNSGRLVSNQAESKGSFIDQRPAQSIELTNWINASIKYKRIRATYSPIKTVTADYTVDPEKDGVILVGTTATITLPDPTLLSG